MEELPEVRCIGSVSRQRDPAKNWARAQSSRRASSRVERPMAHLGRSERGKSSEGLCHKLGAW